MMEGIILDIPWKYREGDKIGNTNLLWTNSIIDREIEDDRYQYMIKNKNYFIQYYPNSDSVIFHTSVNIAKVIARVLDITHEGIKIKLNSLGYRMIPKDIYDKLVASPKIMHNGKGIIVMLNIYLAYKTEEGEYRYV